MTDDILNEGFEEEKKSSDDQLGDDFGLPDLEFDELQELDLSFDGDSLGQDDSAPADAGDSLDASADLNLDILDDSIADIPEIEGFGDTDLDPPQGTILEEGIDEVEDVLDSAQLISDRLGDDLDGSSSTDPLPTPEPEVDLDALMNDFSIDEVDSNESIISDASPEAESNVDDLFADIDTPDASPSFDFEEETPAAPEPDPLETSFDIGDDLNFDLDTPEEPQAEVESGGALFASDDDLGTDFSAEEEDSIFGSDFSLETDESNDFVPAPDNSLPPNYESYEEKESSKGFVKYIIIGVVVIAVAASSLLWFNRSGEEKQVAKKEVKKVVPKKAVAKKEEPTETTDDASTEVSEPVKKVTKKAAPKKKPVKKSTPVANASEAGAITVVNSRTGQSYIIIASFIDEDLAMDYAKETVEDGSSVKIIEPFGESKRYRVSIADYSSYSDASSQLDSYKSKYGDQLWALKY